MLFSDEIGYMTIIYLGATSSQNPNSRDPYLWIDQSRFQFLTNIVTPYAPGVDMYTAGTGHVKTITFPHLDSSGQCVTLIYFPLVMAWGVVFIPCDVQLNVSIYCSAVVKPSTIGYNTKLSNIRIGFAENNFTTIDRGRYCSNDDYYYDDYNYSQPYQWWWFQQDELCLRFHHCEHPRSCDAFSGVCKPHETYFFSYKDAHSSIFDNSSYIAKFLSLFQAKRINRGTEFDSQLGLFIMDLFQWFISMYLILIKIYTISLVCF